MRTKVKICGITNPPDALAAIDAGADVVGFIFYERSPRYVVPGVVAEIARELPAHVIKAGVFVNAPRELVMRAIGECGLNLLQFHGEEPPEYCLQFGLMSLKAFQLRDAATLDILPKYSTDAWLLDAWCPGQLGGTGQTCNWDLAAAAVQLGRPVFLAGGLAPGNVAEAVARVRPYAVDVSSGVEAAPGKKDVSKMKEFVRAAKEVTW